MIHIRRGDYTLYPDHHPTCNTGYYSEGIEKIKDISGENVNIIIFSDDKKWCYENMGNQVGDNFIIPETENPYVELYMMTKCNYHIIANSSFSWWAAYLNSNPNKKIVAPSKWFGSAYEHFNTKDLLPKSWIKL